MLAIETSSSRCSVALCSGGAVYADDRQADRTHKELLLEMVSALCAEAKIVPAQLEALGCGAGPGSFTGVRIGTAAIQALALAADAPVVMVNSLDVLAAVASREAAREAAEGAPPDRFVCARRSRASAYYVASYPQGVAIPEVPGSRGPMSLVQNLADFQAWLVTQGPVASPIALVGELPDWLAESDNAGVSPLSVDVDGRTVLALTLAGLAAGVAVSAAAALPVYLPEDSPWRPQ